MSLQKSDVEGSISGELDHDKLNPEATSRNTASSPQKADEKSTDKEDSERPAFLTDFKESTDTLECSKAIRKGLQSLKMTQKSFDSAAVTPKLEQSSSSSDKSPASVVLDDMSPSSLARHDVPSTGSLNKFKDEFFPDNVDEIPANPLLETTYAITPASLVTDDKHITSTQKRPTYDISPTNDIIPASSLHKTTYDISPASLETDEKPTISSLNRTTYDISPTNDIIPASSLHRTAYDISPGSPVRDDNSSA